MMAVMAKTQHIFVKPECFYNKSFVVFDCDLSINFTVSGSTMGCSCLSELWFQILKQGAAMVLPLHYSVCEAYILE
jgi:hypothetical protein